MVDIRKDSRNKNDTYLLFKKLEDVDSYIEHKIEPSGRFKAEDHNDYSTSQEEFNGVSNRDSHKLTIKTNAQLDFANNECVYDVKQKISWRIDSYSVSDNGQMKEYSSRPSKETFLNLVR